MLRPKRRYRFALYPTSERRRRCRGNCLTKCGDDFLPLSGSGGALPPKFSRINALSRLAAKRGRDHKKKRAVPSPSQRGNRPFPAIFHSKKRYDLKSALGACRAHLQAFQHPAGPRGKVTLPERYGAFDPAFGLRADAQTETVPQVRIFVKFRVDTAGR